MSRVSYIEAGGTNYDIGFRIGECLREKLISHNRDRQAFYRKFCRKHNFSLCPKNNFNGRTVASAIVNLSEMSLSVTLGNPCRSRYEKFFL
jgi:hypothetical protein